MKTRRSMPRVLDAPGIAILAAASMAPAYSIASTMGLVVAQAGGLAPLAVALLSLLMLCVATGFAQLGRTHPSAGSSFGWAETAFGPAIGAYGAWLLLLSNFFATMATALPAGAYTLELFAPQLAASPVAVAAVGAVWIGVSALLLAAGMRPTAGASAVFLITELLVLGASAVAVRLLATPVLHSAAAASPSPAVPIVGGLGGFAGAMVLGIWMSDGWEVSASASEETTEAHASGRGGIAGLIVTTIVLLLAMSAYLRLGAGPLAAHATDVLAYVGDVLGGGAWRLALTLTVLVSTAATLWTTLLYLSRSIFAMGRSGVLPARLGGLDGRGLPAAATLAVAITVAVATLATGFVPSIARALDLVLTGASVFLGLLFVLSSAAAIRLAGSAQRFAARALPAIGGLGLATVVGVTLWQSDSITRAIDLGGLALGVPFAFWRIYVTRKTAERRRVEQAPS